MATSGQTLHFKRSTIMKKENPVMHATIAGILAMGFMGFSGLV